MIRNIPIMYPPLELQQDFSNKVAITNMIKNDLITHLTQLQAFYATLAQKAFRGELELSKVVLPEEVPS